jgi:hypothetical protein
MAFGSPVMKQAGGSDSQKETKETKGAEALIPKPGGKLESQNS